MDDRIFGIKTGSLTRSRNLTTQQSTDFPKLIKTHLAAIKVARGSLKYVYTLFQDTDDIWEDQCDRAIIIIATFSEPIEKLCEILEETIYPVIDITPLYGEFLALLYHFDEQLRRLDALVKVFRTICRTSSKQVEKKRQEIINKLNLFIESYDDILESARYLSEETQPGHILHTFSGAIVELPASGGICRKEYSHTLSVEKKTGPIGQRQEHPHLKVVRKGYVEELHAPRIKLED